MELKRRSTTKSNYSYLDLLGNNELAIAKAFAHLLAIEPKCYFAFLRFIGINIFGGRQRPIIIMSYFLNQFKSIDTLFLQQIDGMTLLLLKHGNQ